MSKTLFVNACVRDNSRTMILAKQVLKHLDGEITECDLNAEKILPLDKELLAKRESLTAQGDYTDPMFDYAKAFAAADRIVIAAPYWDLTFPALLKTYLENIAVGGITFEYVQGVPHSLCKAKQLIYITTAGGPIFANLGFEYVKTLAHGFYGIEDVVCFKAEKLDMFGADVEGILAAASAEIDEYYNKH